MLLLVQGLRLLCKFHMDISCYSDQMTGTASVVPFWTPGTWSVSGYGPLHKSYVWPNSIKTFPDGISLVMYLRTLRITLVMCVKLNNTLENPNGKITSSLLWIFYSALLKYYSFIFNQNAVSHHKMNIQWFVFSSWSQCRLFLSCQHLTDVTVSKGTENTPEIFLLCYKRHDIAITSS